MQTFYSTVQSDYFTKKTFLTSLALKNKLYTVYGVNVFLSHEIAHDEKSRYFQLILKMYHHFFLIFHDKMLQLGTKEVKSVKSIKSVKYFVIN